MTLVTYKERSQYPHIVGIVQIEDVVSEVEVCISEQMPVHR